MKKLLSLFAFVAIAMSAMAQTTHEEHEYVDLGLPSGTLWATCNVGATTPEQYGDYFAWGETQPKSKYSWSSTGDYKWGVYNNYANTSYGMTKYNNSDSKTHLDVDDDAATANWGGDWCMPTRNQADELSTKCVWSWTSLNGIIGHRVTGPNGNSIFLPAAGYRDDLFLTNAGSVGYYWSSQLYGVVPVTAFCLVMCSPEAANGYLLSVTSPFGRNCGQSVRPVCSKDGILAAVETVEHSNATNVRKVMENGQVIFIRDGVRYNVLGTRL